MTALSVVVCTRNRLEKLKRCIDALLAVQTQRPWELIIVDNGSTDGTAAFLSTIQAANPTIVTISENKPGLSTARNAGWRAAQSPLVSFTDDDCYVDADYVDAIVSVFAENPDCGFAAGRVLLFNPDDLPITILVSEVRTVFPQRTFLWGGVFHGANMAFQRGALERIGGFEERLGAGTRYPSGEDLDAASAVLFSGYSGVYDPRPVVRHDHGRRHESEAQALIKGYDAGRGAHYVRSLMRPSARRIYAVEWSRQIKRDVLWQISRGKLPMKSIRELSAGLRFAFGL